MRRMWNRGLSRSALAVALAGIGAAGLACGTDETEPLNALGGADASSAAGDGGLRSDAAGQGEGGTSTRDGGGSDPATGDAAVGDAAIGTPAVAPTFVPPPGIYRSAQSVIISSPTPGATIYYTTDGSEPTTSSAVYSGPVVVVDPGITVTAVAVAPGFGPSLVAKAKYTVVVVSGGPPPIGFAPSGGQQNGPVTIRLATTIQPTTICYTVDGAAPTCSAGICTGASIAYASATPILLDTAGAGTSRVVKALGCSAGNTNSDVTTSTYIFHAAPVTAAPVSSQVAFGTDATFATATPGATIRYNFEGVDPTCDASEQTISASAGTLKIQQNTTVRAIGCRAGYLPSDVTTFAYTVKLSTPVFPPGAVSGAYDTPFALGAAAATGGAPASVSDPLTFVAPTPGLPPTLTRSAVPAAGMLCYRLDGTPSCSAEGLCLGQPGAPAIAQAGVLRVIACRERFVASDVAEATYSFTGAPVAVTGAGNQIAGYVATSNTLGAVFWNGGGSADLTLSTATGGAKIRYSYAVGSNFPVPPDVDCTNPCAGDPAVCAECDPTGGGCALSTVTPFTTLKAVACRGGFPPSALRQVVYADPAQAVVLTPPLPTASTKLTSAQPITLVASSADATICYTIGLFNSIDPTCSPVTGTCTTPGGLPDGITAGTYDGTSDLTKPIVQEDLIQIRARACKAGVPNASNLVTALYRLAP